MHYTIFNPTGNITALVEEPVLISDQPAAAASIMKRHPEIEQVGFVSFPQGGGVQACLRMAGGEFCGNASMCAAVWYVLKTQTDVLKSHAPHPPRFPVRLSVSGASAPVEVILSEADQGSGIFLAEVTMPPAGSIDETLFTYSSVTAPLPVVKMAGISHMIIEPESPFYGLLENPVQAEAAVREWCGLLSASGLGLMFLNGERLRPLVYIPGSDTVFWENSCASGTSAAGRYLAESEGRYIERTLHQPGGALTVTSDPESGRNTIRGFCRLLSEYQEHASRTNPCH